MLLAIIVPRTDIVDPGTWQLVVEIVMNIVVRFNLPRDKVLPLVSWQGFYLFADKNWTEHRFLSLI